MSSCRLMSRCRDAAMPRGKKQKVEILLGRALPYLTLGTYVGGRRYIGGVCV